MTFTTRVVMVVLATLLGFVTFKLDRRLDAVERTERIPVQVCVDVVDQPGVKVCKTP